MSTQVLFIDSLVTDYTALLESLPADVEIHVLATNTDALAQMATFLAGRRDVGALHVVSHAAAGALQLAGRRYDLATLEQEAPLLARIGGSLVENGDILLYGCDVASNESGQAFIAALARLTGADVAASTGLTGSSALGGDWQLEASTGPVEATALFDALTLYDGTLANHAPRLTAGGTLDTSFSGDGKLITDFNDSDESAKGVVQQPDGRILVAGSSAGNIGVVRYNLDGSLDTTFSGDGKLTTPIATGVVLGSGNDRGQDLALQSDGRILVAGTSYMGLATTQDFSLARYLANGNLDTTFSGDGMVTVDFGLSPDEAYSLLVQPDGRILMGGSSYILDEGGLAVVRLTANGSLDTTFSGDGKITSSGHEFIGDMALQTDGKLLVAGSVRVGLISTKYFLARYNANGSLDTTFDGDGQVVTDMGGDAFGRSVVVQADGKILLAGETGYDFGLARYNSDGSLDTSFDGDGKVVTPIGAGDAYDNVTSMALQTDGKILVAGYSGSPSNGNWDFALARYNTDGSLDSSFDGDGKLTTADIGSIGDYYGDWAQSLMVQADGGILLAGTSYLPGTVLISGNNDIALVRYLPGGIADQSAKGYTPFSFTVPVNTFSDPDAGDTLAYSATLADGSALPAWLGFDPSSQSFSGSPTNLQVGVLSIKVTATDTGNLSASDIFKLTVNANHNVLGGTGNDTLYGTAGADTLDGGSGADTLIGLAGNDTYLVDNTGDVVTEVAAAGNDLVKSSITFSFGIASRAELENLVLTGTAASNGTGNAKANVITGNVAANVLTGGGGNDTLKGGSGSDTLAGRAGLDSLTGGLGADKFKFVKTGEGLDTVTDFSTAQGDKLVFVSPNFGSLTPGVLAASVFVLNDSGLAGDADDRFIFETDAKLLWYDADGNGSGAAVQIAKLNVSTLAASDILIAAS